jgi:hypothetical protein
MVPSWLRQVTGTTGEGLPAKKAQRKWQFGRVYSSGCGDGIPPAGRGGFHPERGAPRPVMAGVLLFVILQTAYPWQNGLSPERAFSGAK